MKIKIIRIPHSLQDSLFFLFDANASDNSVAIYFRLQFIEFTLSMKYYSRLIIISINKIGQQCVAQHALIHLFFWLQNKYANMSGELTV